MTAGPARDPGPEDAEAIARLVLGRAPSRVSRFATGLRHFVYDLSFPGGGSAVVRIGRADSCATIAGGAYWSRILRPRGIPLACEPGYAACLEQALADALSEYAAA